MKRFPFIFLLLVVSKLLLSQHNYGIADKEGLKQEGKSTKPSIIPLPQQVSTMPVINTSIPAICI